MTHIESLESHVYIVEHKLNNQKFQISFIWNEENSYYISIEVLQGVHKTTQRDKEKKQKLQEAWRALRNQ
jgi:hypothetical protein